MSLHHRAVIRAYDYSPTLGQEYLKNEYDIGFAWGTKWEDEPRVMQIVHQMRNCGFRVVVNTRDAG
jgi:hypothetical protein